VPENIGPQMLANLDQQLAAGNIDRSTFEARRVEVLELIRKGKAVQHSSVEKTFFLVQGVVLIVLSFGVLSIAGNRDLVSGPVPLLTGLALLGFGISRSVKAFRP